MAKFKSVLSNFEKVKQTITEEKEKKNSGSSYTNPVIFKPQIVKGQSETEFRVRFLPMAENTIDIPWKQVDFHMFERPGDRKFIKVIDPRTFDKKASNPIADLGFKLWKSENAVDKEQAKKLFKKQRFFTFVYVIKAPDNQKEYEGKVLIFEMGKKLCDKLEEAIKRLDNCFWDPYTGQDMLIVIKQASEWPDYSSSTWIGPNGPIVKDEKVMDRICDDLAKLSIQTNIIEKEGIKSGAELKELLEGGMGEINKDSTPTAPRSRDLVSEVASKPSPKQPVPEFGNEAVAATPKATSTPTQESNNDLDDINLDDISFDTN